MIRRNKQPTITIRIPERLRQKMLTDLRRSHPHASERVGFLFTRSKTVAGNQVLVIAIGYLPVEDAHYLKDLTVGAKIGASAIRAAMEEMVSKQTGCFHVHLHDHKGKPSPSDTDKKGLPGVVASLSNISKGEATGLLILSKDGFFSSVQLSAQKKLKPADLITVVGFPMAFHPHQPWRHNSSGRFDRQSFLGPEAPAILENIRVGIIGYGGGGSHVGQQLAHIGLKQPVIFDGDAIEESNLNRLVGGRFKDLLKKLAKTEIAKRVFSSVLPTATVTVICSRWQDAPELLQQCDLIVGGIDTYTERQELEAECRRYLIPYVDIGMDVHYVPPESPAIAGQIMLSLPDHPCFWCYGFLTKEKLGKEAAKYGNVGGRPQVVWPNGVLASTAVGILMELLTGWSGRTIGCIYLEYDGNMGTLKDHIRLRFCPTDCEHYSISEAGPVRYTPV